MRFRRLRRGTSSDEGFTLAETAVEILLLSLVMGTLAFAIGTGIRAVSRHRAYLHSETERIRFYRTLVEGMESVSPPWFSSPRWYESILESGAGEEYRVRIPRGSAAFAGHDAFAANPSRAPFFEFGNDHTGAWLVAPGGQGPFLPGARLFLDRDRSGVPRGVVLVEGETETALPFGPLPKRYSLVP